MNRLFGKILTISLYLLISSAFYHFTIDDAGIFLRYAYNFANSGVLSFNTNQQTYGITSILWGILITPFMFLDALIEPYYLIKFFTVSFGILSILELYKIKSLLNLNARPYTLLLLASIFSVPFVIFSFGVMELHFSLYLLLIFVRYYLLKNCNRSHISILFLVGTTIFFTRPDYVLIIAPLFVSYLLQHRVNPFRKIGLFLVLLIVPGLVFLILFKVYGMILPLPFYAKINGGTNIERIIGGFLRTFDWCLKQGVGINLILVTILLLIFNKKLSIQFRSSVPHVALIISGAMFLCFFILRGPLIVMDHGGRYLLAGIITSSIGLSFFLNIIDRYLSQGKYFLNGFVVLSIAASLLSIYYAKFIDMNLETRNSRISTDQYTRLKELYIGVGQFIASNYDSKTRLAVGDAGFLPYFSRLDVVLDWWSLNEPDIVLGKKTRAMAVQEFDPELVTHNSIIPSLIPNYYQAYEEIDTANLNYPAYQPVLLYGKVVLKAN